MCNQRSKKETGLDVKNLKYKGIYEYVNPEKNDRYIIFNYMTNEFEGQLLQNSSEGKPIWVNIDEIDQLPMQQSIRRRFPLFFQEGTFEIQLNGIIKKY